MIQDRAIVATYCDVYNAAFSVTINDPNQDCFKVIPIFNVEYLSSKTLQHSDKKVTMEY